MKLLTSPDARDLVDRYTALAETAWIARLSQTLIALYFGWPIRSQEGQRRITIISGGVTARVRRNYRLNSLLHGPAPEGMDPLEWEEETEKKNRDDKRHHALDAMVLAFLPGWLRDPNKRGFFRFPEGVDRNSFQQMLDSVIPRFLAFEKPRLEATIYGERLLGADDAHAEGRYAVKRVDLLSIGSKVERNKRVVNKEPNTKAIVDPVIRKDLDAFFQQNPGFTLEQWDAFCKTFRRGGPTGPRVFKVLTTVSQPNVLDEYADFSKDGTKQLRKGKMNQGYFVVAVPKPKKGAPDARVYQVRPVYVHQSRYKLRKQLEAEPGLEIIGYFRPNCLVRIEAHIPHPKTPLKPGIYRLNSLWKSGQVELTDSRSNKYGPIGLAKLIDAGFRRVE